MRNCRRHPKNCRRQCESGKIRQIFGKFHVLHPGTAFVFTRRMHTTKLKILPFGISFVLATLGLVARAPDARASPSSWSAEDALADGDIDTYDLIDPDTNATSVSALRGAPSAHLGHAFVSVLGFSRQWETGTHEIGGFVVLGIPLDRIARPKLRHATLAADSKPAPQQQQQKSSAAPAPAATPAPATPTPSAAAPTPRLTLSPELARSCVAAALRAAGVGTDDANVDAIVSRARWSALLPELRLRAVRYNDVRLYTDTTTTDDSARLRDSAGGQMDLEARLTWRLDRLIYSGDEPAFERLRLRRQDTRAHVAAKVLDALFHWQRALLLQRDAEHDPGKSPMDQAELALHVMEAEATLDVLTNGWFSISRAHAGDAGKP